MKNGTLSTKDCAWGKAYKVYLLDNWPHRLDGPAVLAHHGYGRNTFGCEWWIYGDNYTFEDWKKHPLVIQFHNEQLIKIWTEP